MYIYTHTHKHDAVADKLTCAHFRFMEYIDLIKINVRAFCQDSTRLIYRLSKSLML